MPHAVVVGLAVKAELLQLEEGHTCLLLLLSLSSVAVSLATSPQTSRVRYTTCHAVDDPLLAVAKGGEGLDPVTLPIYLEIKGSLQRQ